MRSFPCPLRMGESFADDSLERAKLRLSDSPVTICGFADDDK
jgi:hypothetical protein